MIIRFSSLMALVLLLGACESLQGLYTDDTYYSPRAAYGLPLDTPTFRGKATLQERCDETGGSTTFWDETGRQFRIDYFAVDESTMAEVPRFASDQTILNSVMANYYRQVLPQSPLIKDLTTLNREFLKNDTPKALFVLAQMDIESDQENSDDYVRGTFYYGFYLFKRGEFIYVIQHRQPTLMANKMKSILRSIANSMMIPGMIRDENEMERTKRQWQNSTALFRGADATTVTTNDLRLCE